MSNFLYIVENCGNAVVTRGELVERGLFAVVDRGFSVRQLGPGRCMVAHGRTRVAEMVEDAKRQVWAKWGDGITFGRWIGSDPTPESLRRARVPWRTVAVPMGANESGDAWEIPVLTELANEGVAARFFLPIEMLHTEGAWTAPVAERYARLEGLLQRLWFGIMSRNRVASMPEGMLPLMLEEQAEICREALGLVYRLSAPEISALRLLTPESMQHALCALLDIGAVGEALAARARSLAELHATEAGGDSP